MEAANATIAQLTLIIKQNESQEHLHELQAQTLKEEIKELQRSAKRNDIDLTYVVFDDVSCNFLFRYLKNVILKYMETQDHVQLLPVISNLLQFSPEELKGLQQKLSQKKSKMSLW